MDPENTTTDTTAPVAATTEQPVSPPATEKPSGFSQEDVNRIVAKRLEEDRARRPAAAPAPKPAPTNTAKPSEPDLRAELDEMRRQQTELMQRLDYTSRTAKLGLDDARAAALFKVYQTNPDGFDELVATLGIKAPQNASPQPAATAAPQTNPVEQVKPAAAPSAPAGNALPMHNGMIDIFQPGVASQLGPQGTREQLEKLWKIGSQLNGAPARPKIPSRQ